MNKLTTFQNIAYGAETHATGTAHFFNDEAFFDEFYRLVLDPAKDVVDLGFNIGLQAEMFLRHSRGTIFGFEASTKIYEHACERFKDEPRIRLFNLAVSNFTGTAEFIDTKVWGAGSLKYTSGMVSCSVGDEFERIRVPVAPLDEVLKNESNVGVMKLDIEGAELLALEGAREFVRRNRPFMVMEYCHNALSFEFRGQPITGETLFHYAKELGYKVYNIYGICLANPEVWQSSILQDTADVFLIPDEQHERWVEELLPVYQYHILDKILERLEWAPPLYHAVASLPTRLYGFVNAEDPSRFHEHFAMAHSRLSGAGVSRADIIDHPQISERGKLLLLLTLDGDIANAIRLARIVDLNETELQSFRKLALRSEVAEQTRSGRRPYYLLSPDYARTSAGTRAMYLLCHHLNALGEEAYVVANTAADDLNAPLLADAIRRRHFLAGRAPIAVYPEVAHGNPLGAPSVARYVLNHPGLIGGPTRFDARETVFFYNTEYARSLPERPRLLLQMPLVDRAVFHPPAPDAPPRKGILVYPGRDAEAIDRHPALFANARVITREWPASHAELAELLRGSERLYSFSNSAINQEAVLCGCPVVIMESMLTRAFLDLFRKDPERGRPPGMAVDDSPAEIERASASIGKYLAIHERMESAFPEQLAAFVAQTQSLPVEWPTPESRDGETPATTYLRWVDVRQQSLVISEHLLGAPFETHAPTFHLLVRLAAEDATAFAGTIDNLEFQRYNQWLLDVITPLPAPAGIEGIDCIGWHTIPVEQSKHAVDTLVAHRSLDWIVELPAGAVLDPLCLWRVARDALADPDASAFFVDDDVYDHEGLRSQPRFKPGVNPAWLRSSDLAGPLFVRRDAWIDSGGAAARNGSPWFDQLLRLTRRTGWSGIRHIADVLVSYPRTAPGDLRSCLASVLEDMQTAGAQHEVLPLTDRSWSLRPALDDAPRVTIAVLSRGQTDLLGRCLASIVERTAYADYDLLIAATDCGYDPELHDWLDGIEVRYGRPVRVATTPPGANQAARCNAAVAACDSDLIAFVREECIIVQAQWLEELVRSGLDLSVAAVAPRLIDPRDKTIIEAGRVLGLDGSVGTPYRNGAGLEDAGMLDQLKVTRDASILSATCMLVRTADYRAVGDMDPEELDDALSDADLCLRLRAGERRLIVQPLASVVYRGDSTLSIPGDAEADARRLLEEARSRRVFAERWLRPGARDPFWNPNLSLARTTPTEETAGRIQWNFQPVTTTPRILARPLPNAQGHYRIESPLAYACAAGVASGGIWPQADDDPELAVADLSRLAPTSLIVQNYLLDHRLQTLQSWHAHPHRPFTVYALDDLITDLDESNPGRRRLAANARARLQRALAHCDRLVVSTDTLAEAYRHFIDDVRVVPNRLDDRIWLPLQAQKHTASRPRIGWAGGSAHERDLMLLKPVIERTRAEADWVFFGMCPEELRPLIAEYHEFGALIDYPERLAALNLDLAVAPLADTPFNHAKSNLRLLECGVLGIPVVCSDVTPYRDSPACRIPNDADQWTEALRARIHDPDARDREGRALRQWVRENFLLGDHLGEWLGAHLPA